MMEFHNPGSGRQNPFRGVYDCVEYVKAWQRKDTLLPFPLLVDIELTNHCNLKCFFCGQVVMNREKGFMSRDTFTKVADECARHKAAVRLIRWGEPFLHKNIVEFCRYMKAKGIMVHITTNGIPLTEAGMEAMVEMQLDSIKFSFQGATKEKYQAMRNNDKYDTLKANIEKLIRIRGDKTAPYIHISSTMTDESADQIEAFTQYWGHIVDSVGTGKTNMSMFPVELLPPDPELRRNVASLRRSESIVKEYRPCGEIYRKLSVDWDGKVTCCCSDYDNHLTVGHVAESSLEDIWKHSKSLRAFRDLLDNNQHRSLTRCAMCYHEYEHINVAPDKNSK